ncbi:hypothetical protein V9T40_012094 [Parthenolecanium corni]|uniref:26S proteasome non-ATPase regulatory subunit 10 n=1 Tax=Parthenolecanium corni TaxID=536013 RepID=A0AAN9Y065_9HEMI
MLDLDTKIFMNAYEGKVNLVTELVDKNEKYVTLTDSSGRLLLHWAALGGHDQLVSYLLSKGQPVNAQDDTKMTPLILAASAGRTQTVKILLNAGAEVNSVNEGGHSALQYSASKGWKEIVEVLVTNGADLNIQDSQGASALHRAASKGVTAIVSYLLECDRPINVNSTDSYGNTPLHLAAEEERADEVQMLLQHGADPNMLNKDKKTPDQLARFGLTGLIESKK